MSTIEKVLIANRGEIAVRVARACRDAGLSSVAVYADPDRDAPHVRVADEAYALGGSTAAESYLVIDSLLNIAHRSGANAVHPGYGFLSENADFAQAVIDAGLIWIGPPPHAIRVLGDKIAARRMAAAAGAPHVPGTFDPVSGVDDVIAFAQGHGLPIAIKAVFGGGGRGLRVARTHAEIPDLYDAAVREAFAAFGRGECFVERYVDRPRHVETQCLADVHGTIVVVSTRDCSLQRRHQKLVEEAPAPFLSPEQIDTVRTASVAILREAGYVGAGTCEFLLADDGTISFLEVNTRLQVEHPVTEQVTGIDLVREQFRIANGEPLGYSDPQVQGHAMEFRINGEDPARAFLPSPGVLTRWRPPAGPGVRVDSGVQEGDIVGGAFDSLLAKLIITGATRSEVLQRARRALAEFEIEGMATTLSFHRAVVDDPAFAPADDQPFTVHTRWIETECTAVFASQSNDAAVPDAPPRQVITVEVDGKRFEVALPMGVSRGAPTVAARPPSRRSRDGAVATSSDAVIAPMQGTIVTVHVQEGDTVTAGDVVLVLEAMKMEQPLTAHKSGTVRGIHAQVGATVAHGTVLLEIAD